MYSCVFYLIICDGYIFLFNVITLAYTFIVFVNIALIRKTIPKLTLFTTFATASQNLN